MAEVDSLIETYADWPRLLISARVLSTFWGRDSSRIRFPAGAGLYGCSGGWSMICCFGPRLDPGNEPCERWYAPGDTIFVILSGCPRAEYESAGFVRWLRSVPDEREPASMFMGEVAFDSLTALCEGNPDASESERYSAMEREWIPDGRTLEQLKDEAIDFYANRRREYLAPRFPNPWRAPQAVLMQLPPRSWQ